MPVPAIGERAPDFTLRGTEGQVRLADLLTDGPVLLLFYTEDLTPACTQQLCAFRDESATLAQLAARVVAISADSLDAHRAFIERLGGLPYPLLADPDLAVARRYGVDDPDSRRARRAAFVIGRDGAVRHAVVPYQPSNAQQFLGVFEALGLGSGAGP